MRGKTTIRWKNQRKYDETPPYHNLGQNTGGDTDMVSKTEITITNKEWTRPPMKSPSYLF